MIQAKNKKTGEVREFDITYNMGDKFYRFHNEKMRQYQTMNDTKFEKEWDIIIDNRCKNPECSYYLDHLDHSGSGTNDFNSEWEVIEKPKCDCPDKTCDGKHPKDCPIEEHKCEEDIYGNCYTCGKNMLLPTQNIEDKEFWRKFDAELANIVFNQDNDNNLVSLIKKQFSLHREQVIEEIREKMTKDLSHPIFCKAKGEQFRECALCYIERLLDNLKNNE